MKIGWLLGWATPEAWFAPLARAALPGAEHVFAAAAPGALGRLETAGPFDWMAGYSLGTLLLLSEAARSGRLGRVALLAPIFAFPREAALGGKIPRAQVRHLARYVRRDPSAALTDFYRSAGLDAAVDPLAPPAVEELLWGLERLEDDRVEPPLPKGWRAWCGSEDALLDAARLGSLSPSLTVVREASHHPAALLRAFASEAADGTKT